MAFKVCQACGAFSARHEVIDGDPGWAVALCPACGAGAPFRRLPLFVMTGPSGAGKTTTCRLLLHSFQECVVLESDILYGSLEMSGDDGLRRYWDAWLRVVMNVHQAARPVLLCGTLVPSLLESLPSQAYLGGTRYAALTCEDVELERRLRARLRRRLHRRACAVQPMVPLEGRSRSTADLADRHHPGLGRGVRRSNPSMGSRPTVRGSSDARPVRTRRRPERSHR